MCDLLASTPHNANKMTGSPEPQDPAVMVFSSGTTGLPKAILFSHKQVCDAIEAILDAFDDIEEGTVLLCWLPLANLFQRVINFCAIGRGATSYILSDPRTLMDHIGDVKPHILIGVPRVFERMQTGIVERIEKLPLPLRYLAQGSLLLGRRHAVAKVTGKHPAIASKICWFFVEMLILSRLRAAAFGGRMRYFISGSAAMPLWLLEWFEGLGLPVLEAYGISENIIPISANRFSSRKLGAVGKPVSPTQISLAPDGEILVRGPGVCGGYWRAPAASSERFTLDGFWRSGDVGCLDEEGFLSLLGRKSEAFKTSGGKWVLPMRIEEQLRRVPYISESIVLQLDSGVIASVVNIDRSKLSSPTGGRYKDEDVLDEKFFRHFFAEALQIDLKTVLADLPAYQRPIGVVVTFQQFSIQGGELTTNMKVRRGIVIERFESQLKRLGLDIARASETARSAGSSHVSNPVIVLA
jgi:long-chain acyl-CoA synthetase